MPFRNPPKIIKYENEKLFLRRDGTVIELGTILTKRGGLTRKQKLTAVHAQGQWVKV